MPAWMRTARRRLSEYVSCHFLSIAGLRFLQQVPFNGIVPPCRPLVAIFSHSELGPPLPSGRLHGTEAAGLIAGNPTRIGCRCSASLNLFCAARETDRPGPALAQVIARANACFGDRAGAAAWGSLSATAGEGGRTIVGRLVSKTVASGHLWAECRRMMVLSTPAPAGAATSFGKYQSARKSSASNRLPAKMKYRARGIYHRFCCLSALTRDPTGKIGNGSFRLNSRWKESGKSGNLNHCWFLFGCGGSRWLSQMSRAPPLRGPGAPIG